MRTSPYLIIDADYNLFVPGFNGTARHVYKILRKINPHLTELAIRYAESFLGSSLEHLIVSLVNRTPLTRSPLPIVDPFLLTKARRLVYEKIGVYSIRPEELVKKDTEKLGYGIDVIVGPKITLSSFIRPTSLRKQCIIRCMQALEADPTFTTLASDSPEDHKIAKELEIAEIWAVRTGYYQKELERHDPHKVFRSLQEALVQVTEDN